MAEWDEEGDEKDMDEFTEQPELQWGFMGDADGGKSQPPGFNTSNVSSVYKQLEKWCFCYFGFQP